MKINKVSIKGIGGIDELDLEFKDGINMISGANGIGKTTILNIIKDAFTYNNRKVKRNVAYEKGEYSIEFNHAGEQHNLKHEIKAFEPEQGDGMNTQYQMAKYIMSFEENRDIKYIKLGNIPFDPKRSPVDTSKIAVDGISADDLKGWFANRFLFSKQEKSLTDKEIEDFELTKTLFHLLDNTITFSTVKSTTGDIMLNAPKGEIYFEYLSSGYRTCIFVLFGIIKEIEFRFKEEISTKEFDGVILIDEVDVHLHPLWQAKLIKILKTTFDKAQIIATTHSPSVLQSLEKDEIIALACDDNGERHALKNYC